MRESCSFEISDSFPTCTYTAEGFLLQSPRRGDRSSYGFILLLATILLISRSHTTELPTAAHFSQSSALNPTVENAFCSAGVYTTRSCSPRDNPTAAHSQGFENSPLNALRSSDRELNTANSEKNTRVVNPIVCA